MSPISKAGAGQSAPSKHPIKKTILISLAIIIALFAAIALWLSQAVATHHPTEASPLGREISQRTLDQLLKAEQTGASAVANKLDTLVAADWQVPLNGLLNLNHPKAKAAGLINREEGIQIYAYHLQHPKYGDFLIDTGISTRFATDPKSVGVPGWLEPQLKIKTLKMRRSTEAFLQALQRPLKGVFMTHLHLDHMSGLPAIPTDVPLYTGKGEATEQYFLYAATNGTTDTLLDQRPALREWQGKILDIFGDGSAFALHTPGHTVGSTAYLIRSESGWVLLTGDTCHTAWGWQNNVEPGQFSSDQAANRESLEWLQQLAKRHPQIKVQVGHQPF